MTVCMGFALRVILFIINLLRVEGGEISLEKTCMRACKRAMAK